jgi:hypothetical protein
VDTEQLLESNTKIKPAATPPTHCASCFGQYPDRRHVDFNAYWDGPVFARDDGDVAGGAPISVDDLVICEECVAAAATVLELTDDDTRRHVLQMEREVEELRERLLGATTYIAKLEDASVARGKLEDKLLVPGGGS